MGTVATPSEIAVDEFVSKLKSQMQAMGVKPKELAERAEVGFPYLYRVLKGEQTPSISWAAKVGKHVGLRISTEVVKKAGQKKACV